MDKWEHLPQCATISTKLVKTMPNNSKQRGKNEIENLRPTSNTSYMIFSLTIKTEALSEFCLRVSPIPIFKVNAKINILNMFALPIHTCQCSPRSGSIRRVKLGSSWPWISYTHFQCPCNMIINIYKIYYIVVTHYIYL